MRRHLATALLLAALAGPASAATFTIVNTDGPGEGLNDPTPVAPLPSNAGTTLGAQRLFVLQRAAEIWGSLLESDVEIRVEASFDPLACSPTFSLGGFGGWISSMSDFPGAQYPLTWYPVALANKLAGVDLDPGPPASNNDIFIIFNSDAALPACFGQPMYLGTDDQHGTALDLFPLALHEIGHGLGFANFVDETTGETFGGQTDVYSHFTLDNTLGQTWSDLDPSPSGDAARAASALRCGKIAWNGPNVTAAVPSVLDSGTPTLTVTSPAGLAGDYLAGKSTFGALLTPGGVSAAVEVADDGTGVTSDACEPLVGFTPGHIALVDRGTCFFVVKAANAQAAGAVGVLVADNVSGCPPPEIGGTDPSITIPVVRITLEDGLLLKGQIPSPGVTATLRLDSRFSGADSTGHALLYASNPATLASSISHWEAAARPNLLMEPFLSPDLDPNLNGVDLTLSQMRDIGWFNTDLSIAQSESADPVMAGTLYSYFLDVTNGGSGTDLPVTVTSTLPAGAQFVSASGTGWACAPAPGTVTCTRAAQPGPDLAKGAAPQITLTLAAPLAPGIVNHHVSVTAPQPLADLVPANNESTASTTVVQAAVLSIRSKSVTGFGLARTYTITLTNTGPTPQTDNPGDELVDTLPAGLTLTSASAASGIVTTAGNTVRWNGALPVGATVTVVIQVAIDPSLPRGTTLCNQATVSFDADGDGTNETTALTDDPAVAGAAGSDPTCFLWNGGVEVPALSLPGLLLFALALLGFALRTLVRRRSPGSP